MEVEEVKEKFLNFFKGLGKFDGFDYLVKFKFDENLYVISILRRVYVFCFLKVKEELFRME